VASREVPPARLPAAVATLGLLLGASALFISLSIRATHESLEGRLLKLNASLTLDLLRATTELQAYLTTGTAGHLGAYRTAVDQFEEVSRQLGTAERETGVPDTLTVSGLAALTATMDAWEREVADPAIAYKTSTSHRKTLSKKGAGLTAELGAALDNATHRAEQFLLLARDRYVVRQRIIVSLAVLGLLAGFAGLWRYIRAQQVARAQAQVLVIQLNEHARRFEVIAEFSEKIHYAANEDHAARHLVAAVSQFAPHVTALLETDGGRHLRIAASDGELPPGSTASPLLESPQICPVMRTGQRFHVGDVTLEPPCPDCPLGVPTAGGYVCVPLTANGRVVGVVNWQSGPARPLLPADVQHFEALSRIASLVLMSQSALVQARQEAETDTLTGAFNRRFLDSFLDKQAQSTLRHHQPLGVLMMDLDHFKTFNDRHGHPAGDAVLRLFARTAHETVREGDLVARYGGEEFTVVLPNADRVTALEIAERIRDRFTSVSAADLAAAGLPGVVPPAVTVSIGVAVAPNDGRHAAELIRAADAALYQAKQTGRNRVMPASG